MYLLKSLRSSLNNPKVKKICKLLITTLVVCTCILLVIVNIDSFKETTNRFKEIFKFEELKCFFELYNINNNVIVNEIQEEIKQFIQNIINYLDQPKKDFFESLGDFCYNAFDFLLDCIIYFGNFGMNILFILYIYFHEVFTSTHLEIKTTKLAKFHLQIKKIINKIILFIKKLIISILKTLKKLRKVLLTIFLLYISSNGILYKILVELLIFIIVYIYKAINLECYLLIFEMFKSCLIYLYPHLKNIPYYYLITATIILIFITAIKKANYKLMMNHERLKTFAKDEITQTTFINGPPGTGKTLLNVSLSLASEENFIEELESKLLEYEIKYPNINFSEIRNNPTNYKEHEEYIKIYQDLINRGTFIISNYAIYSPYFNEYSKIFNFNFMRKNKQTDIYALEQYNIISISELDKEYNSHDDLKKVGEDGAATFFSTVSHDLKRKVKIFCDYQLKDQVPLRIRGNSEFIYTIQERKKKYPFLLGIYYFPVKLLSKLCRSAIIKYEQKREFITKKTKRKTYSNYKRNDYTLFYSHLRGTTLIIDKLCNFFDHYWYFRIKGHLATEDGEFKEEKIVCLNICDLSINNMALYDSTFLSYAYESKKNMPFKDLESFTTLTPSVEELTKCNSRFYNKINGIDEKIEKNTQNKYSKNDEIIDV